ncbi:MAG: hypothetical protein HUU23_10025 [Caldilineales bacterium]|nr:hypothetical protein [Caldilineales bacterium]
MHPDFLTDLERLSNTFGVSGTEDDVADLIVELLGDAVDETWRDTLGNLFALRRGESPRKLLLDAHMDEVGFLVRHIDDQGFLSIVPVGGWDERFAANEDYDLNTRLRQAGGQLIVDPAIRSAYLARDSLAALARQYARYGAWRTVTWRKHPGAMRLRHLAPAALTAALGLGLLALPLSPWPLLLILSCYLLPLMAVAALLAGRHGLTLFPTLLVAFLIIHLAWGLAFWPAWLHPPRANAHR